MCTSSKCFWTKNQIQLVSLSNIVLKTLTAPSETFILTKGFDSFYNWRDCSICPTTLRLVNNSYRFRHFGSNTDADFTSNLSLTKSRYHLGKCGMINLNDLFDGSLNYPFLHSTVTPALLTRKSHRISVMN